MDIATGGLLARFQSRPSRNPPVSIEPCSGAGADQKRRLGPYHSWSRYPGLACLYACSRGNALAQGNPSGDLAGTESRTIAADLLR